MPKKSKNTRKQKRRNAGGISAVPKPLIAPVTVARMGYCQYVALSESASGVGAYHTFRLNSLFDPDFTGTGLQPPAFDQMCQLYSRYKVLKVHAQLRSANSAENGAMVVMFPSSASALPASCVSWSVQPFARSGVVGKASGYAVANLNANFDLPSVLGLTKSQYLAETDYSGIPTASPLRLVYLHIGNWSATGVPSAVWHFLQLEYLVEWSQPVLNSMS